MDNDEIHFDDIKREVLPDGRIRYYAEKIVTEIVHDCPRTESEITAMFRMAAEPFMKGIIKEMMHDPYLKLLEGSDMASNEA